MSIECLVNSQLYSIHSSLVGKNPLTSLGSVSGTASSDIPVPRCGKLDWVAAMMNTVCLWDRG